MKDPGSRSLISYFIHWLVSACAVVATCMIVPGWSIQGFGSAMIAAAVIGIANAIVRPVLLLLTLPVNILTFGLFTFVMNGAVIMLCSSLLDGFEVAGWGSAIIGSLVLAIISMIFHFILG